LALDNNIEQRLWSIEEINSNKSLINKVNILFFIF